MLGRSSKDAPVILQIKESVVLNAALREAILHMHAVHQAGQSVAKVYRRVIDIERHAAGIVGAIQILQAQEAGSALYIDHTANRRQTRPNNALDLNQQLLKRITLVPFDLGDLLSLFPATGHS